MRESRSRISDVHLGGLRFGHPIVDHARHPYLHDPHRHHRPEDRFIHQLAVRRAALGSPPQRQTTSTCHSDNPALVMSSLPLPPPPSNPPPPLPNPGTSAPLNPGTTSLSVLEPTLRCVRPAVSTEFHHASRCATWRPRRGQVCRSQALRVHHPRPLPFRPRRCQGPQSWAECRPGQRRRGRCRIARAPRNGSCGRLTRRRAGGRVGGMSELRCLSRAPGRASHEGGSRCWC
jgi:hypothetical protein